MVQNTCIANPLYCSQFGQFCVDDPDDEDGAYECQDCHFGAVPDVGTDHCVCDQGMTEINEHCVEIPVIERCDFEDTIVRCHPEQITIHLAKCAFTDGDLDLGEIHLAGTETVTQPNPDVTGCQGHFDESGQVVTFVIAG